MEFMRKYGLKGNNEENILYTDFNKPIDPSKVPGEIPQRKDEIVTGEQYYLIKRIKRHRETISKRYSFRI